MVPFQYPAAPLVRRHGPRGYRSYASFRPWLRDEFIFRCVFCLRREQWDRVIRLEIDHFQPTSQYPRRKLEYDNLLYACWRCNRAKSDAVIDDPSQALVANTLSVAADGRVVARSASAKRLVAQLRLNNLEMVHFRRLWIEIIAMSARANPELHRKLLGFPTDLPNLRMLRPPGGNRRPAGLDDSYFALRERDELAGAY